MKTVEPSFEILHFDENSLDMIEQAGRICYQSEPKGSPSKFVANLISRGHMTPLEMADATVKIICDRGISHELVRHRLISANQSSTRYCNYANDKFGREITVIKPPFWEEGSDQFERWTVAMEQCELAYMSLRDYGAKPEEARSVLPNSLKTEIIIKTNMREWRHIFKLRCAKASHPQMRQLMLPLLDVFHSRVPVLFQDLFETHRVAIHSLASDEMVSC